MAAMLTAFARLVRETARRFGHRHHGLHGRRGVHSHRLVPTGRWPPWRRPGDRRRADPAQHRQPPQGGGSLEAPDAGRRLPLLDTSVLATMRSIRWPAWSQLSKTTRENWRGRSTTRSLARPAFPSAGSKEAWPPTWCPTGARSTSTGGSSPANGRPNARGRSLDFLRERLGDLKRVEFLPPWVNMPPLVAGRSEPFLPALQSADRARRRPDARDHRRPLRDRRRAARRGRIAVRRLRAGGHRPGPHEGRVGRTRPGPARLGDVFRDRAGSWDEPGQVRRLRNDQARQHRRARGCVSRVERRSTSVQKTSR